MQRFLERGWGGWMDGGERGLETEERVLVSSARQAGRIDIT